MSDSIPSINAPEFAGLTALPKTGEVQPRDPVGDAHLIALVQYSSYLVTCASKHRVFSVDEWLGSGIERILVERWLRERGCPILCQATEPAEKGPYVRIPMPVRSIKAVQEGLEIAIGNDPSYNTWYYFNHLHQVPTIIASGSFAAIRTQFQVLLGILPKSQYSDILSVVLR